MKRIRINGEFALFIGLLLLAAGIVFTIKADFGMTVVQSPVYILSVAAPKFSIGVWNYIVQGGLFIVMLLIIRRFKVSYVFSFITGIVYGLILDLFTWLFRGVSAHSMIDSIIFYILSIITVSIAVALFFCSKAPLMPYDIFVREVASAKKINLTKFKWLFDISFVSFAVVLSLLLTGSVIGIGIGTLISALLVSPIMSLIIRFFDRYCEFVPLIK